MLVSESLVVIHLICVLVPYASDVNRPDLPTQAAPVVWCEGSSTPAASAAHNVAPVGCTGQHLW